MTRARTFSIFRPGWTCSLARRRGGPSASGGRRGGPRRPRWSCSRRAWQRSGCGRARCRRTRPGPRAAEHASEGSIQVLGRELIGGTVVPGPEAGNDDAGRTVEPVPLDARGIQVGAGAADGRGWPLRALGLWKRPYRPRRDNFRPRGGRRLPAAFPLTRVACCVISPIKGWRSPTVRYLQNEKMLC